ncbi:hypothetical protein DN36_1398 [Vibrio cholerae]|nr:inovirus-type Gp2 protein [Vibrio cholerae]KFE09659.1 hypothetical protein DN36_1398 [Vibrio cholerae]
MKQTKHLTTIAKPTYLGRELCKGKCNKTLDMFKEYLDRIDDVMDKAISDHPRTTVIRVDLKFPCTIKYEIAQVMKRFISSLSAQINADIKKNEKKVKELPTVTFVMCGQEKIIFRLMTIIMWHYSLIRMCICISAVLRIPIT